MITFGFGRSDHYKITMNDKCGQMLFLLVLMETVSCATMTISVSLTKNGQDLTTRPRASHTMPQYTVEIIMSGSKLWLYANGTCGKLHRTITFSLVVTSGRDSQITRTQEKTRII